MVHLNSIDSLYEEINNSGKITVRDFLAFIHLNGFSLQFDTFLSKIYICTYIFNIFFFKLKYYIIISNIKYAHICVNFEIMEIFVSFYNSTSIYDDHMTMGGHKTAFAVMWECFMTTK